MYKEKKQGSKDKYSTQIVGKESTKKFKTLDLEDEKKDVGYMHEWMKKWKKKQFDSVWKEKKLNEIVNLCGWEKVK